MISLLFEKPQVGPLILNNIMAFDKHHVVGETSVLISPTKLAFVRGVEACLKAAGAEGKRK